LILRLILGDQLNPKHSWFDSPREDVIYALLVALQRDYRGLDFLEADFSIVRLGMRYKI
jgi:deoxyribodipyrimidine photolyase-like uncharacterized protein